VNNPVFSCLPNLYHLDLCTFIKDCWSKSRQQKNKIKNNSKLDLLKDAEL